MKQKTFVLLLGCTPFLLGRMMDWAMLSLGLNPPFMPFNLLALALWVFFTEIAMTWLGDGKKAILLLNLPAAVCLALILIQELLLHGYWFNFIGAYSQLFYLPFLPVALELDVLLAAFGLDFLPGTMPPIHIAAFLTMLLVSTAWVVKRER